MRLKAAQWVAGGDFYACQGYMVITFDDEDQHSKSEEIYSRVCCEYYVQ